MLRRLLGLETEYAIRFSAPPAAAKPRNDTIYEAVRCALGQLVLTRPGRPLSKEQCFTENGGEFSYESLPYASDAGLVEGATPECRGPSQALLYQKAQDRLLCRALPLAETLLREQGYDGTLGLLKNCRDAEGHIYGAQENYEVELARGGALFLWRVGIACLIPVVIANAILTWGLIAAIFVLALVIMIGGGLAGLCSRRVRQSRLFQMFLNDSQPIERVLGRWGYWLESILWTPVMILFLLLVRLVAFRRIRRHVLAFLLSRPVITGAGTLNRDGTLGLSEKGPAMRRLIRWALGANDRAVFEPGNLCKQLIDLMYLRVRSTMSLLRRRQRMQLGLSDSNMAQVAEFLKVATTGLVIDMAEAGALDGLPRLRDPLAALRAISSDPSLATRVEVIGGEPMRAIDIQRAYQQCAHAFVHRANTASLEAVEVVRRWGEVLDALEQDPGQLFGRLDWVSKQALLEQAGAGAEYEVQKKIDLRYHELGCGYFAMLESRGLVPRLVSDDQIERALREPPEKSPAQIRGQIIRNLHQREQTVRVSWDEVRVGGPIRGTVIRLDDYRDS